MDILNTQTSIIRTVTSLLHNINYYMYNKPKDKDDTKQ